MDVARAGGHVFPPPAPPRPPEEAPFLSRDFALPRSDPPPEFAPALVFSLPVLCAVDFPALAEIRCEWFGQEEQLDEIASRRYVFLCVLLSILDDAMAGRPTAKIVSPLLPQIHKMIATSAGLPTPQPPSKRHHEGNPVQDLGPPSPAHDYDLRVHTAESSIRDPDPAPWPPNATLPLPGCPE